MKRGNTGRAEEESIVESEQEAINDTVGLQHMLHRDGKFKIVNYQSVKEGD